MISSSLVDGRSCGYCSCGGVGGCYRGYSAIVWFCFSHSFIAGGNISRCIYSNQFKVWGTARGVVDYHSDVHACVIEHSGGVQAAISLEDSHILYAWSISISHVSSEVPWGKTAVAWTVSIYANCLTYWRSKICYLKEGENSSVLVSVQIF